MKLMNRGKQLVKNTLVLSIGTFFPKLVALITIPIITKYLSKAEFGTYDLLSTLVALLLPILTFQIHSAAFRFLIDCRNDDVKRKRVITNIFVFLIPISTVVLLVLFFILNQLSFFTRILIVLYFFSDILLISVQQIIRGLSQNKLYSISAIVQSLLNMFLIVLTVRIQRKGLNGVLLSFTVATFCSTFVLAIKGGIWNQIDLKLRSTKTIKEMLAYSWPMIPNTLSNWVLSVSDRLVLSCFMGVVATAVYGAANKIPQLFTSVQGTFIFAWQENASLALDDEKVEEYYSSIFDRIFGILVGVMAILICCTPVLFKLLIKGDYDDAYPHMPILFMGMFFSSIASFLGGIYVAHKKTKNVGVTTIIAAFINLLINLSLIGSCGIYAASISTVLSYLFLAVYRFFDVLKFQNIRYDYRKIIISVIILVCMCVIFWFNSFAGNIVNCIIGIIIAVFINRTIVMDIINKMFNFEKR
mgnify:CR=1 FL=1